MEVGPAKPEKDSLPRNPAFVPYAAIERHGLIGDRRTAALVAADGTLDWLCLPDFDGPIVFGALLDCLKGGYWRVGPELLVHGSQEHTDNTMMLETRWDLEQGGLLLSDVMLWPESARSPEQGGVRAVVRSLRCTRGRVRCQFDLQPRYNFGEVSGAFTYYSSGFRLGLPQDLSLRVWASAQLDFQQSRLYGGVDLQEGEEFWTVLEIGAAGHGWSVDAARSAVKATGQYWRDWLGRLNSPVLEHPGVRGTALAVHLLTYASEGSVVAAPTTSLPERIGGTWNADYRLCWVRDTSLAVGILSRLGNWHETEQYLHWLTKRQSRFGKPLQVLYDIRGGKRPRQRELAGVDGYKGSRPVRIGNHAYKQHQFGSVGFLADCVWLYVLQSGPWREEYWKLIRRAADFVAKSWRQPDNGIWELSHQQHYVHSKVLCWVTLDRAIKIAEKVRPSFDQECWDTERSSIHQEVMEMGWSEQLGAFRQHYGSDSLDAAELLIPILGFLPGNHPRVISTINQIAERLTIDGFVYRFNPLETQGVDQIPMGQSEGAFVPCTCWLASAYAIAGQPEKASTVLASLERLTGSGGLLPEAVDPRNRVCLGNTPLLFSHVEFVRAKLEVAKAQGEKDSARKAA